MADDKKVTDVQVEAALGIILAVANAIQELGEVPSGELYARLMAHDIKLDVYEHILRTLKGAGLVRESNHLLTWIGPARKA
jgi:hypothetical protein